MAPIAPSAHPAGAPPLEAPRPAVTPAGAVLLDEPPPRSFDRELPRPRREASPPPPPPAVWPHLREDDEPRRNPPPPARSGLWPRLPDEDDLPPEVRSADLPWPALPGDDLELAEEPVHGEDHDRIDRLRGEQQGARWSGRHS